MGHSIDKLQYDKSFRDVEFYKCEYNKALPFLQIISSGVAFGRVSRTEVEELRRQLAEAKQGQNTRVQDLENRLMKMQLEQEQMMKLLYEHLPRKNDLQQEKGRVDE